MFSKELDNYIKFLSQRDTKNLTQKTLKTTEELGELAKKVLPYENAFATNHRIVTKNHLLEEISDTMLCLISIAHDIGASDEEFESMIARKASVWQEKQDAELGCSFPVPFEIHITVEIDDDNDIKLFKEVCSRIGVKPIVIDLQKQSGENVMRDVMTSSKHFGDNNSVMSQVDKITQDLRWNGFKVVRQKVESVPWHPAAPRRNKTNSMPKDCYFECHFAVLLSPEQDTTHLDSICRAHGLHKSRNIFKKYDDGVSVNMLTARAYNGTYEDFLEKVERAKDDFITFDYQLEKEIIEFSIYDTKVDHDGEWISAKNTVKNTDQVLIDLVKERKNSIFN